jgi:hypothetical protein
MPEWLPPLAAASLVVLLLNVALVAQRARSRDDWAARFLRDLRRWDGRLTAELQADVRAVSRRER